ncbi:MAG: hypothetical protein IVW51_11100 [Thermaceae bacterium]|nr:hypothetical protein [Thermaceae bacterium]
MMPAGSVNPFTPLEEFKPKTLIFNDFIAGSQGLSQGNEIAYFDVPLSYGLILNSKLPMRFYLKAAYEFAYVADALTNVNVTIPDNVLQSGRNSPVFPTQNHPDLLAYISSDAGATWAQTTINSMNWNTETLNITKLAATNRIRIFYLSATGGFQLRVFRPVGSDSVNAQLFNQPFFVLNSANQSDQRSAPRLNIGGDRFVPSQWRISLQAQDGKPILWLPDAQHDVAIEASRGRIQINDLQKMNAMAEVSLRGGNI